jgi:ABC-2 type transport system permease protein
MSGPAAFPIVVLAQIRAEGRLTARRGENLLAMVGIPAAALLFFGTIQPPATQDPATVLPGVLGLAIVASGLVNLGISTAYERGYGVLKRLGGSPLGREGLLAAKLVMIGVIAVAQVAALIALAVAVADGVPGATSWPAVLATTLAGAGSFAAVGLLLAGAFRPDATLVLANALFLVAILLGGVVVPLSELPEPLGSIARVLPFGALAEAFRASLGQGGDWLGSLGLVVLWGVAAALTMIRTFRWD